MSTTYLEKTSSLEFLFEQLNLFRAHSLQSAPDVVDSGSSAERIGNILIIQEQQTYHN